MHKDDNRSCIKTKVTNLVPVEPCARLLLAASLECTAVSHPHSHANTFLPLAEPLPFLPAEEVVHTMRSVCQLSGLWQLAVHLVHSPEAVGCSFEGFRGERRGQRGIVFHPV